MSKKRESDEPQEPEGGWPMQHPLAEPYLPGEHKALVIHWNVGSNTVWMDTSGLSCFEVTGLLQVALDVAEDAVPAPLYAEHDPEEYE